MSDSDEEEEQDPETESQATNIHQMILQHLLRHGNLNMGAAEEEEDDEDFSNQ